ncbi:MAG: TolC family protein [Candidatus Margulisiibacteriota bacterium]
MRRLWLISFSIFIWSLFSLSFPASTKVTLNQFLAKVLTMYPSLKTLHAQVDSQRAALQNTGSLAEPFLSYESAPNPMVQFKQKINNPLKVQTDQSLSSRDVALSELRLQATQRSLTATAKKLYYRLYALNKLLSLTREEQRVLDQMYRSSLRQYETNLTTQQDPLTMSLMRTEVTIKLEQLNQEQQSLLTEAKRWVGGDDITLLFPDSLTVSPLDQDISFFQKKALSTGNLEVALAGVEFEKATLATHLTDLSRLFELELGAGYDTTMGTFSWMAGISLPLWIGKIETSHRFQDSLTWSASENMKDVILRVRSDVANLVYKIQSADHILPLYEKDLLPKAKQARNLGQVSYQTGKQRLSEWATAEQRYLTLSGQFYQLLAERLSLEADLEEMAGTWR